MPPAEEEKRSLIGLAITHLHGSIHANDSKSAAGLVVQGLLATAVLGLLKDTGASFADAPGGVQAVIRVLLGLALATAVASTICFVRAINPYESKEGGPGIDLPTRSLFFPDVEAMKCGGKSGLGQLRDHYDMINEEEKLTDEYLSDLFEVAKVRAHEAKWARWGFRLLGAEILLVALYLGTVGLNA